MSLSANRVVTIVQTAVYEAAMLHQALPRQWVTAGGTAWGPVEAAIAAASRATPRHLVPSQRAMVDSTYDAALARIADGPAKSAGIAVGERAAAAVMAMRAEDDVTSAETYRPLTSPGAYVPTVIPVVPTWPLRKPWLMGSASQFRPGPPPALSSEVWARDYNEIKAVGSKNSTTRTAEQIEIARFWDDAALDLPRGRELVATAPGRDITQNARLLAAACQAADDALIAIFDAKYSYTLAADHRDPKRGHRRQRRNRAGPGVDAIHRHPHAPRVSVRPLYRRRGGRHRAGG
jgi:hypothetical protein